MRVGSPQCGIAVVVMQEVTVDSQALCVCEVLYRVWGGVQVPNMLLKPGKG